MSHGLPTGPYAEFSVDDPIANSSQLVLPTHTAPASNSRCTAVPVYGGLKPSRIFEPAVVSIPSTQSTSLSAIGMPQSGDAVSGCSSSIRAARIGLSGAELARDREVRVERPSRSARRARGRRRGARVVSCCRRGAPAASSVMVLGVKFRALDRPNHEVAAVGRGSVAQRLLRRRSAPRERRHA